MTTLLKNANLINVFTNEIYKSDILIDGQNIVGVGDYSDYLADVTVEAEGKFVCPGLIDGHIHIESTMLMPYALSRACIPHGTTAIVADPHEIANVCGKDGIRFMIESSVGLPFDVYVSLPSCVPATPFDEAGAVLSAEDLEEFYSHPRVVALGEMMNYVGVNFGFKEVHQKIIHAKINKKIINGHAPLLSGKDLDKYVSAGIRDDHECSNIDEALEKLRKGQKIMIRQGSAATNLMDLLDLFDGAYADRCMLVSDDKHPSDLLKNGHLDNSIKMAIHAGKDPVTAIKMATIVPAQHFGLSDVGAVAPGYKADVLILDDLNDFKINTVIKNGEVVFENGDLKPYSAPTVPEALQSKVTSSVKVAPLTRKSFKLRPTASKTRVINLTPGSILTTETQEVLNFDKGSGISVQDDILKVAVIERHHGTQHIGIGFVKGAGLKKGAIASTVSHDSHNLIVIGASEEDMATACNRITEIGGGLVAVDGGEIIGEMALPIAGLMTEVSAKEAAEQHEKMVNSVQKLGVPNDSAPFMNMAFLSLPVIPHIKITTLGLVDVNNQSIVDLFVD